jgi:hypothetical protein
MPRGARAAARRTSSLNHELPPSTIASPASSSDPSVVTVCSVAAPAGTITHTARGGVIAATSAASDDVPTAPSRASAATASALRSLTTH